MAHLFANAQHALRRAFACIGHLFNPEHAGPELDRTSPGTLKRCAL
jgi:hypothetical protein